MANSMGKDVVTVETERQQTIGKYRIGRLLGESARCRTFLGQEKNVERPVVIKLLNPSLTDSAEGERFREEALAGAHCRHSNIVTVLDYKSDGRSHYLVTEFVEGETLQQRLQAQGAMALRPAAALLFQVLNAVEYLHDRGDLLRDLKPGGILILPNGYVKVLDFGIAADNKNLDAVYGGDLPANHFQAPEFAAGRADERGDIFTLGHLLFTLLSGRAKLPKSLDRTSLADALAEADCSPASAAKVAAILGQCLTPVTGERFASVHKLTQALAALLLDDSRFQAHIDPANSGLLAAIRPLRAAYAANDSAMHPSVPSVTVRSWPALQKLYAHYVGPMAGILLKKAEKAAVDADSFLTALADNIPNDVEQQAFLDAVGREQLVATQPADRGASSAMTDTTAPPVLTDRLETVPAADTRAEIPAAPAPGGEAGRAARRASFAPADGGAASAFRGSRARGLNLSESQHRALVALMAGYVGPIADNVVSQTLARCRGWSELQLRLSRHIPDQGERDALARELRALRDV